jgi:heterotetrameric sarcosine oxidase gamma subunit
MVVRVAERADTRVRRGPIHHRQVAQGAAMVPDAGWARPERFAGQAEEVRAATQRIALFDESPEVKWEVRGRDLEAGAASLGFDPAGLGVGRALRTTLGERSTRGLACRLTVEQLLLLGSPAEADAVGQVVRKMVAEAAGCLHATDLTAGLASLRLVGPGAPGLLRRLAAVDLDPRRFPDLACAQVGLAKVHAIVVRRDVAGLVGYTVLVGWDYGEYVWDACLEVGHDLGVVPAGLGALRELVGA